MENIKGLIYSNVKTNPQRLDRISFSSQTLFFLNRKKRCISILCKRRIICKTGRNSVYVSASSEIIKDNI